MDDAIIEKIKANVLRELGTGATDLKSDIDYYLESTVREIAAFYKWNWLDSVPLTLSTDSGQEYITIPAAIAELNGQPYIEGSGNDIRYKTPEEYNQLRQASISDNVNPGIFTVIGKRIYFYPPLTTGGSVKIVGSIDPNQISADDGSVIAAGVISVMPNDYDYILECGTLSKMDSAEMKKGWLDLFAARISIKKDNNVRTPKPLMDQVTRNSRQFMIN
jgi:hypothetical protein